jgi:ABC-2 type transport system ATP-binding protein
MLEVSGLHKTFTTDFWKPKVKILHDVSFYVPKNSICGIVGPNGAGKTTTIKSILDFVHPDQGKISIMGKTIHDADVKANIGYLPEQAYYYDYLTAAEILNFYAKLFGIPSAKRAIKINDLLALVRLDHARDKKLRSFSKGMLQRVGIAQALINDPDFVILDEPMSGLDPIGRREVREIIFALKQEGKTVMLSSHILSDIEFLCDYVVMIVEGRVKSFGKMTDVVTAEVHRIDFFFETDQLPMLPEAWQSHTDVKSLPNRTILHVLNPKAVSQSEVLTWAIDKNLPLESFVPHKDSLEDSLLKNIEENKA